MIDKRTALELDLPKEVILVYEDAARLAKVDFNTVITVTLAVHIASRRSAASTEDKPKAKKAERKAKSK